MMRVIPRDLFNDGNLLTNYGHMYIALENINLHHKLIHTDEEEQFNIAQDIDGNTYLSNVKLLDKNNEPITIYRSLNSREKYSLWFEHNEEYDNVFDSSSGSVKISNTLLKILQ